MTNELEFLKNIIIKQFLIGTNEEKLRNTIQEYNEFLQNSGLFTDSIDTVLVRLKASVPVIVSMHELFNQDDFENILDEMLSKFEKNKNQKLSLKRHSERNYYVSSSCGGGNSNTDRC